MTDQLEMDHWSILAKMHWEPPPRKNAPRTLHDADVPLEFRGGWSTGGAFVDTVEFYLAMRCPKKGPAWAKVKRKVAAALDYAHNATLATGDNKTDMEIEIAKEAAKYMSCERTLKQLLDKVYFLTQGYLWEDQWNSGYPEPGHTPETIYLHVLWAAAYEAVGLEAPEHPAFVA